MAWDVMSGVTKTAWDVMSGVTKTAWDVLSGVANLCGMFCPGWQKMAWDVLSRDVLSGSRLGCGSLSITTPVSLLENEFDVLSMLHLQVSVAAVNQVCVTHVAMNGCKNLKIH